MANHSAETFKKSLFYLINEVGQEVDLDKTANDLPVGVEESEINALLFTIRLSLQKARAFDEMVDQLSDLIDAANELDTSELNDEDYFRHQGSLRFAEALDADIFKYEEELTNAIYGETQEWFDRFGELVEVEGT